MIERPQMTTDEVISVEMQHKLVSVSIQELCKTSQIPLYAEYLANEKEVAELERVEALLSVIITHLRCLMVTKKNSAIIVDLTERLRK